MKELGGRILSVIRSTRKSPVLNSKPSRSIQFLLVFFGLVLLIPLLALLPGSSGFNPEVLWPLSTTLLAGWKLSKVTASTQTRLLDYVFWVFCYVWLGVAPAFQIRNEALPTTTPDVELTLIPLTSVVVDLGILAFILGSSIARARERGNRTVPDKSTRKSDLYRALVLSAFGLVTSVFYVQTVGFGAIFTSREQKYQLVTQIVQDTSVSGILTAIAWVPSCVSVALIVKISRETGDRRLLLLSLAVALPTLVIFNPLSTARYVLAAIWGGLALTMLWPLVTRNAAASKLLLLSGFIIVFPALNVFRYTTPKSSISDYILRGFDFNGDYDAYTQITNALQMYLTSPPAWGRQALGVVAFWVPRSTWPGKPLDTGILLAQYRGYSFTNLSAPIWAELLLNFGFFGVLAGFFLIGVWVRKFDSSNFLTPRIGTIYGFMVFYSIILLRGSLLQATGSLTLLIACSLVFTTRLKVVNQGRIAPTRVSKSEQAIS